MRRPALFRSFLGFLIFGGGLKIAAMGANTSVTAEFAKLADLPVGSGPSAIVVSDGSGPHATVDGTPALGLTHEGIGRVFRTTTSCTGALLSTGRHVLTAAHCATGITSVDFTTTAGSFSAAPVAVTTHPSYDGDELHGYDVAVLEFVAEFDPSIPRYEIVGAGFDTTATALITGFGNSGVGSAGATFGAGIKRVGLNAFEAQGLGAVTFGVPDITNNSTQLTADFDSGVALQDAFDFHFAMADTGFGNDEVGVAVGDSGGPAFFDVDPGGGTDYRIGGVNSYIFRLEDGGGMSADINGAPDSSYGEFFAAANVADPAVNSWIASQIPEPSTALLSLIGFGAILQRRRR